MLRVFSAVREWLELRARLRGEYKFHLDLAAENFRALGYGRWAARRKARARFGSRRNLGIALRELGGDWTGLVHLLRAHRVGASAWVQPAVLLSVLASVFLLSPAPREVADGVLVRTRTIHNPGAVILTIEGRNPWREGGITPREFEALRSMVTVTDVGKYRGLYARASVRGGVALSAIESEARARTGNPRLVVTALPDRTEIAMGPAQVAWAFVALWGVFFALNRARQLGTSQLLPWRWLLYGVGVAGLHAAASLATFSYAFQLWERTSQALHGRVQEFSFAGIDCAALFVLYLIVTAIQCRSWWIDLRQRCPICLDRLVLPLQEGLADRVLFNPCVTESVCALGHGVLVESRWSRRFRPQESPLERVVPL